MFYRARYYDNSLGRFSQADTMIPGPGNPLAWDRYAGMANNPLRYNDPSGHTSACAGGSYGYAGGEDCADYTPNYIRPRFTGEEIILMAAIASPPALGESSYPFGEENSKHPYKEDEGLTMDEYLAEYGLHAGVDFGTDDANDVEHKDLYAIYDGTVVSAYDYGSTAPGQILIIEHIVPGLEGNEVFYSVYFHVSKDKDLLAYGTPVKMGQKVGNMGNTGTGSVHLHFEIRKAAGVELSANGVPMITDYWANSSKELRSKWVDISYFSHGYGKRFPQGW